MENIGRTIMEIDVPVGLIWGECCLLKMTDYRPKGNYQDLLAGNEQELSKFIKDRMKGHVAEGMKCNYNFTLPAVIKGDGRFVLLDGHHRCTLAIATGRETVKLAIKQISPLFDYHVRALRDVYGSDTMYQEIQHPFFKDWKQVRGTERFDAIKKVIEHFEIPRPSMSIDVGSCTGGLVRYCADLGFFAVGFDIDLRILQIAEWLNSVFPKSAVTYYQGDGFEAIKAYTTKHIKTLTCLSVLHHFLWNEGAGTQRERFVEWIKLFSSHSALSFIDTPPVHDQRVAVKDIPLEPEAFIQWMEKECGVKYAVCLGTAGDSHARPMFAISNEIDVSKYH